MSIKLLKLNGYKKTVDSIHKVCSKNFDDGKIPAKSIYYTVNEESRLSVINVHDFEDNVTEIIIEPESVWSKIKSSIDEIFINLKRCSICKNIPMDLEHCDRCHKEWCTPCHIDIFKTGKGIVTCPFCSFYYGEKLTHSQIKNAIKKIKMEKR